MIVTTFRVPGVIASILLAGIVHGADPVVQVYDRAQELSKLDLDKDGLISAGEYNGTQKLFDDWDTDGDGALDPGEAGSAVTFVDIPSGIFVMGSSGNDDAAGLPMRGVSPPHEVTIDAFKMASTEVTTAQYTRFLNEALRDGEVVVERGPADVERVEYPFTTWRVVGAPGTTYEGKTYMALSPLAGISHNRTPGHPLLIPVHPLNQSWIRYTPELERFTVDHDFEDWPVVYVKWHGAAAFAEYYGLSLPTEAEWEYAARGGDQFRFATSDGEAGCDRANYRCYNISQREDFTGVDTPEEYLGYRGNVGRYPPNPFGVFDLAGSVWEWVLDWYAEDFYQSTLDQGVVRNPLNLSGEEPPLTAGRIRNSRGGVEAYTHDTKVARGGSYQYQETTIEAVFRNRTYPFWSNDHVGFRVVLRPPATEFNGDGPL